MIVLYDYIQLSIDGNIVMSSGIVFLINVTFDIFWWNAQIAIKTYALWEMASDIHTCKNPEIISTEKYSTVLHIEKTTMTVSSSA